MNTLTLLDAAYPPPIWPAADACAVYLGGWDADHVWTPAEIASAPARWRLPVWVAPPLDKLGQDVSGAADGREFLAALRAAKVPRGVYVALDMETMVDPFYVSQFGAEVRGGGYRVLVYGSGAYVYQNPPLDGYWAAWWGMSAARAAQLASTGDVRAVQYVNQPSYDKSALRPGRLWDYRPPTRRARAAGVARRLAALLVHPPAGWRAVARRRVRRLGRLVGLTKASGYELYLRSKYSGWGAL